jgi:hypothetical protein
MLWGNARFYQIKRIDDGNTVNKAIKSQFISFHSKTHLNLDLVSPVATQITDISGIQHALNFVFGPSN